MSPQRGAFPLQAPAPSILHAARLFIRSANGCLRRDWPDEAMAARADHQGRVYHRYRLSVLSSARKVGEALVYSTVPLTTADEFSVFRALFPNRGGVFQIEKTE
jgi:hypothetical protein